MMELAAVLLIALDRPVGGGTASIVARFDSESVRAIPAIFLGEPSDVPPIEWFLDGDGVLTPLAVAQFVPRPEDGDPPELRRGEYRIAHQGVIKPTYFRGLIRTLPPREVRMSLFPPDWFDAAWKMLAQSGLTVCLSGELAGLRPLLDRHDVVWRESDLSNSDTIDRNGLLIVEPRDSKQVPIPGMAKYMAVFDTGSLAFNRFFELATQARTMVIDGSFGDFADEPLAQQLLFQLIESPMIQ